MPRIILLGASNVTLSFPRLWHGLGLSFPKPLEVFAAHGHGRSFGNWSRVGPRALPGIVPCRLWDDLTARPAANDQPRALIADVGNDLLYGIEPQQIADWVATCIKRLQAQSARIVLTQLPVASAHTLSRSRFRFFRRAFFPRSRFRFEDLEPSVIRLNGLLLDLGSSFQIPTPELRREWYGVDPIHIRPCHRAAAWSEVLASWFDSDVPAPPVENFRRVSTARAVWLWKQRPFERQFLGRIRQTPQPIIQQPETSELWLY